MQKLWQLNFQWDESLPEDLVLAWKHFEAGSVHIKNIFILRRIICDKYTQLQLHGFFWRQSSGIWSMRSTNNSGSHVTRLELCAAVLLTRIFQRTIKPHKIDVNKIIFWPDSTITLHCINTSAHSLKTVVVNRVNEIQQLSYKVQ